MAYRMGLLGKKVGMSQSFDASGACIPLCVVEAGPCVVLDIKTMDKNGYTALQLGFSEKRAKNTPRPQLGLFSKAKTTPKRFIREIRIHPDEVSLFQVGQTIHPAQIFSPGDLIDATGTSKGKGFQGVMKRYHFRGFRATHGTHEYFRHGGSLGCRLTPGRVTKGKRMGGQMGNKRVTVQNLRVVEIIEEKNLMLLSGAVPGAPQGFLVLKQAIKRSAQPIRIEPPSHPELAGPEDAPMASSAVESA
jgi:large subunit ribosomal protein L3